MFKDNTHKRHNKHSHVVDNVLGSVQRIGDEGKVPFVDCYTRNVDAVYV